MRIKWLGFFLKLCVCGGSHLTSDLQVSSLVDKFSVLMVLSLHFQLGESFDDLLHFLSFKIHGSLILFSCCKSWDERFLLSCSFGISFLIDFFLYLSKIK